MTFPAPRPGLVIRYSFLWSDEKDAGADDGLLVEVADLQHFAFPRLEPLVVFQLFGRKIAADDPIVAGDHDDLRVLIDTKGLDKPIVDTEIGAGSGHSTALLGDVLLADSVRLQWLAALAIHERCTIPRLHSAA